MKGEEIIMRKSYLGTQDFTLNIIYYNHIQNNLKN